MAIAKQQTVGKNETGDATKKTMETPEVSQ
jgi:hypothetical protein